MKAFSYLLFFSATALALSAAIEEPIDHRFKAAEPDPLAGDWQGSGKYVAQVVTTAPGKYQANILHAFDQPNDKPLAVLTGTADNGTVSFSGGGWSGTLSQGSFKAQKESEQFELKPITRTSPTMGAKPPAGAVVLFDGKNLDAWANKKGKDWLTEGGPAPWKIVEGGILEVVPGTGGGIISRQKFGDCHLHVEFRTLGAPSNSGVFLETRYEANINESYGRFDGTPNAGFDNCTDESATPKIRATRPPLVWQTFDIDFRAPRFDASGKKTESARATVLFNGVKIYDQQELGPVKGAAGRLGEAPTGPLMLQEHGMPVQFRNIWLVEKSS